jgi:NADPH dehydrogenase (quinone)
MQKVLIINAHQKYEGISDGTLNQAMVDTIKGVAESKGCDVKITTIETGYDIKEEVNKHLWADLIITQSPVYWFATPWIHKKYIDEVFTSGLVSNTFARDDGRTRKIPSRQYGSGGKMQGKKHLLSLTWNAPQIAFSNEENQLFRGKTVDDVFFANMTSYVYCGAEALPSFSCFDVHKNPQVEVDIQRMKSCLNKLLS